MKSLLDIQQDVRMLENRVKDIAADIGRISSDIGDMRDAVLDEDIDYGKIGLLANRFTFGEHPLAKLEDKRACRIYLEMLLNIVRLDAGAEAAANRLVFIQWLQMQADVDWSLEDLYRDCLQMKKETYAELADSLPAGYIDSFIVDGFITAGISGSPNREVMAYMADLSAALWVSREKLRVLSTVAHMVLCQSVGADGTKDLYEAYSWLGKFSYYMDPEAMKRGRIGLRNIALELVEDGWSVSGFQWKAKNGQMVKAGDVIATFGSGKVRAAYKVNQAPKTQEIQAPVSGTLFHFKEKGMHYGVIAHETDNMDSIKAWVRQLAAR